MIEGVGRLVRVTGAHEVLLDDVARLGLPLLHGLDGIHVLAGYLMTEDVVAHLVRALCGALALRDDALDNGRHPPVEDVGEALSSMGRHGSLDLLLDAMPLTHAQGTGQQEKGRNIGPMQIAGPSDYQFQSTARNVFVLQLRTKFL